MRGNSFFGFTLDFDENLIKNYFDESLNSSVKRIIIFLLYNYLLSFVLLYWSPFCSVSSGLFGALACRFVFFYFSSISVNSISYEETKNTHYKRKFYKGHEASGWEREITYWHSL